MAEAASALRTLWRPAIGKRTRRHFFRAMDDAKMNFVFDVFEIAGDPIGFAAKSKSFHAAKCFFDHAANGHGERLVIAPGNDASAARHEIYETAELQFDGGEIGVNIRVIEFERSNDEFVGMVVQKFRALVEKRRIVFVAFEDEFRRRRQVHSSCRNFPPGRRPENSGRRPAT